MIPLKKTLQLKSTKNKQKNLEKIVIPCCKAYEIHKIQDILRCEARQNYCRIFLKNGSMLTSTSPLGHYKELLQNSGFLSCHRSHLVNLNHIQKYYKEGSVELSDTSTVPVSRRMKDNFLNQVMDQFYS